MVVLLRLQEIKIMAKIIFKNIILEIAAYTLSPSLALDFIPEAAGSI